MKNEKIKALIVPTVEAAGYTLWGVEYVPQGKHSVLRIYIDKEAGVGIADCQTISRQVGVLLDVENPIKSQYTLEVSSPGMDRTLFEKAHYQRYVGQCISVKLTQALEQKRKYVGLIERVEDNAVVLNVDDERVSIPFDIVMKANLVS